MTTQPTQKKGTQKMCSLALTISWKHRPHWPKRVSDLQGYESIADARRQLQKRFSDKRFKNIPHGFKYEEPFDCGGERGTLVYTITEKLEQEEAQLT